MLRAPLPLSPGLVLIFLICWAQLSLQLSEAWLLLSFLSCHNQKRLPQAAHRLCSSQVWSKEDQHPRDCFPQGGRVLGWPP